MRLENIVVYAQLGQIVALEEKLIYNSLKNTRIVLSLSKKLSFGLDHCSQAKFLQSQDEQMEAKKKKTKMKISTMKRKKRKKRKKKRSICGILIFP